MNLTEKYRPIFGKVLLSLLLIAAFLPAVAAAQSPTPSIVGLLPNSVKAGSAGFTLNVLGAQFVPGAVVQWNGAGRVTNFFSSTLLEATIPATDLVTGGTVQVTVANPGGVISNALPYSNHHRQSGSRADGHHPANNTGGRRRFLFTCGRGEFYRTVGCAVER